MKKKFQGKVALVTGGASGIGKGTALVFAREGAKVIVSTDSNIKGGEETVRLIQDAGGEAAFVKCDVTKESEVRALVEACVRNFGRLDYAFNNAGVGPDGKRFPFATIIDCSEDIWDRTIDINLKGVFLCMKHEIKQMMKQKYGAIVSTSSTGAFKAVPGFAAYDASKAGLLGLTRVAALECAPYGVRVNLICPGPTGQTMLMENLLASSPDKKGNIPNVVPLGRLGTPEEQAEAVIWLCSDAASFVTGVAIPVDGGMCTR